MIRILAVDDEKPIVELLKLALKRSGYQCVGAYDGIQAANLIEKEAFDLILLDIMLPGSTALNLWIIYGPQGSRLFSLLQRMLWQTV